MHQRSMSLAALAVAVVCAAGSVHADDRPPVVVGAHPYAPWIVHSADGAWSGIAVDVWSRVASELGIPYRIVDVDPKDVMEQGPARLGIDVVLGLAINPRTEKVMDVSHGYLASGLAIATRADTGSGASRIVAKLASWHFVRDLGLFFAIIMVIGVVVWRIEHKASPEDFGGTPLRGIGGGVMWTIESLFSKPRPLSKRWRSRFVALAWVIVCMLVISGVTAKLAAEFTVHQLAGSVSGPKDLAHARVGALIGASGKKGSGARYLDARGIGYRTFVNDPALALDALDHGELDAVVDDDVTLRYLANQHYPGRILVLPDTIDPKEFAIGLRLDSPLRKPVDLALLGLRENGDITRILARYLGGAE